jgi:hypothetical protein
VALDFLLGGGGWGPGTSNPLWCEPNFSWGALPLSGRAYSMSEWSCRSGVFSWWSWYIRRWHGRFYHSSICCQVHVGAWGYALSCPTLNGPVTRGSQLWVTCLVPATPRCGLWGLGVCQAGAWGGVRSGRTMVKSYLSIATVDKKDRRIRCLGLVCFWVGGPSPSNRSSGIIYSTGYLVPQPFTAERNNVVSRFVEP